MKKKLVLTLLCALTLGTVSASLVSCGTSDVPVVTVPAVTKATITNKTELGETWRVSYGSRMVSVDSEPNGSNISQELIDGKVIIESSDTSIINVVGKYLYPLKVGKATISVSLVKDSVKTISDSVELTIVDELKGAGTSVKDAILKAADATSFYYVTGKISRWKSGDNAGAYGNFYITDLEDATQEALVYGISVNDSCFTYDEATKIYTFKNDKSYLTDIRTSGLKIGDVITIKSILIDYNGTRELSGVYQGMHKTIPELLAVENKKDVAYTINGTIKSWYSGDNGGKYGNLNVTDADGNSVIVYGLTATAGSLVYDAAAGLYNFNNPKDFLTNEKTSNLVLNTPVLLKVVRSDYNGTVEVAGELLDAYFD